MDVERVREELRAFVELTTAVEHPLPEEVVGYLTPYYGPKANDEELLYVMHRVEAILNRLLPTWRSYVDGKDASWQQRREVAVRALSELDHRADIDQMLGDDSPTLSAGRLHPWAWEGAQSMWRTGHYSQGVVDALKRVNFEAQNKTGRRDLSETKLFQQLFSRETPRPDAPRLRLMADDGGETHKNVHRGAAALAESLFAGVRNPVSHIVVETEVDEQVALEQLAAVSVLARWVDAAAVVCA